jgi:hypothetical protein
MLVSSCEGAQGCETSRGPRYPMPHKGAGRNPKQTDRVLLLLFLRRRSTHSMALVSWEASGGKLKCVRMCVCVCVVRSRKEGADEGAVGGGGGGGGGGWGNGWSLWSFVGVARPIPSPLLSFAWRGIQGGYVAERLSLAPRSTSRFASR